MKQQGPLRLESISKLFQTGQKTSGAKNISLEIAAGEGFSLLGPSGCGKSTTLRLIGGFETPDSGRIFHNQKEITSLPPQKREIRTVFQRYALFPHLNVTENVAFGLRMQKRSSQEIEQKVNWALELLEITQMKNRPVSRLSGGEQQRVALARALVTEPAVLLLDEPLSALDLKLREKMQLELLTLRHKLGSTFLFVTHDQNEAMTVSDRIAVMREGEILQVGTPQEIYHTPNSRFVAEFIGQANFLNLEKREFMQGSLEKMPSLPEQHSWMVRPEMITPRANTWSAPAGHVAMSANIIETAFLGADRITKAKDISGGSYLLKTPGFEPMPGAIGQEILLSWETEDMWIVASS